MTEAKPGGLFHPVQRGHQARIPEALEAKPSSPGEEPEQTAA
jgi:hypothetical protein